MAQEGNSHKSVAQILQNSQNKKLELLKLKDAGQLYNLHEKVDGDFSTKIWGYYEADGLLTTLEISEIKDLSVDELHSLYTPIDKYIDTNNKTNLMTKWQVLEQIDDNTHLINMELDMPFPFSHRYCLMHLITGADDGQSEILTSEGTEEYAEKYADLIKGQCPAYARCIYNTVEKHPH